MSRLLAVLLLFISTQAAEAWPFHGDGTGTAPILQAVSVPFGVNTITNYGDVALSSPPVTTTAVKPQTYPGLGLMSPTAPACALWTLTFVSNSAGRPSTDFTIIAPGTADATAVTPVPSSTGNQNLAGTYVWSVSCTDAGGHASNTVNLTYTPDANTATIGSTDALNVLVYPGGFGSVAGAKITAAVGMDRHVNGYVVQPGSFANTVTITPADVSRRPYVVQLGVQGANPGNILIDDWVLSGAITGSPAGAIVGIVTTAANAVSNITFDHIKFYGSETLNGTGNNGANGGVGWIFGNGGSCASNCVVQNSEFDYVESGTQPKSNTALRNVTFRYVYNNCIFLTNFSNFELSDVKCLSPMQRFEGAHPDMMQICDGCVPGPGIVINRFLASQADGDYFAQGPIFGGSVMIVPGYVDDGTGAHGPGNIFTKTSSGFVTANGGIQIAIPSFISGNAGVTMSCIGSCATATQATLVGLAATNIGSSGSPVNMYGVNAVNLQMSGIMSSQAGPYGITMAGNAGASYLYDYDYVTMETQHPAIGSFTGSITSGVLTATTAAVSNIPGQVAWIAGTGIQSMGRLNYSGCAYASSCTVLTKLTGADTGPGTYTTGGPDIASTTIQISGAYGGFSVPAFEESNCNFPDVQAGSFNIDRGLFQSGMFPRNSSCLIGNFPGVNATIGSHAFGPTAGGYSPPGGAVTGADYASGVTPTVYLAAHNFTATDTADDILRINCLANKPSLGGKRDAGGGLGYGSVTPATNVNGTGGGDWMIWNGSAHVASTHITGCELAP